MDIVNSKAQRVKIKATRVKEKTLNRLVKQYKETGKLRRKKKAGTATPAELAKLKRRMRNIKIAGAAIFITITTIAAIAGGAVGYKWYSKKKREERRQQQEKEEIPSKEKATEAIASLLKEYPPSPKNCLPGINKTHYNPQGGVQKLEFACLIAGYRNVVIDSKENVKKLFGGNIEQILATKNIGVKYFESTKDRYNAIFFRPEGTRNAELLQKYLTSNENSEHLLGTLLEYGEPNIELYHKLSPFRDWVRKMKYKEEKLISPSSFKFTFPIWPPELKERFNEFTTTEWKNTLATRYENIKKYTEEWISSH